VRLLVVGGCGKVGSMVVPHLAAAHHVRVLDLAEPTAPVPNVTYHQGDLHDVDLVAELSAGVDSVVFMAMGPFHGWGEPAGMHQHLDIAVAGLHLVLAGAHRAGVAHAVFTSSMSVYRPRVPGNLAESDEIFRYPDESVPPDAGDFYGLAKRLGEEVCRTATEEWGMDTVCLRLCFPTAEADWPLKGSPMQRIIATSARDTAAAIDAALSYRGKGFATFAISGDGAERAVSTAKAHRELGWRPRDPTG
jgi:nucleoside-diphosphate-sugar epimerase